MSDSPLSILHLTAGSDAGGLSRYVYDMSLAMHQRGHRVAVAGQRGEWHSLFESAPFEWIETPLKGNLLELWQASRRLRTWMRDRKIDVIHSHYRKPNLVGRKLQTDHRPPLLYTLHLSHISLSWPNRLLTDFGDHVHVASADACDWMIKEAHFDPAKITLIPHGVHVEKFPQADESVRLAAKQALGFTAFDTIALYVGRLDYPKNCDWLVHLANITQDRMPRLRVLLVGDGPDGPMLRQMIREKGLEQRVLLMGQQDPLLYYQAADALLLPSLREGFSYVTAEAMSVGVPVLRTRTSGTAELIIEGVTGKSTEIDRPAFLGAAVAFLSDTAALRRMGAAAAKHIRENLTFEKQLEATIALYRKLIA